MLLDLRPLTHVTTISSAARPQGAWANPFQGGIAVRILQRGQFFSSLSLLFALLVLCPAIGLTQQAGERVLARNLTEAKFAEIPGGPDCFTAVVERGNPQEEPSLMLMKGSAGCVVPWHWHPSTEEVMMLSGNAQVAIKGDNPVLLRAGGYLFVPIHHVMQFRCTTACTLWVYTNGPFAIHYVDEEGKEISPAAALKTVRPLGARPLRQ